MAHRAIAITKYITIMNFDITTIRLKERSGEVGTREEFVGFYFFGEN
jgi:hypothetical protein